MADKLSRISISRLLCMMESEYSKHQSIFGIPESLFFKPTGKEPFRDKRFGHSLGTPLGVAAGPHSQMAQNIISAWLCGARYIELKTIQTLDELDVSKPCIDMQDEGYNCEWSQELRLNDSLDEYVNAWVLIHILHYQLGFPGSADVIFNMSAGYNMEGILKDNVQSFFAGMADAEELISDKITELSDLHPEFGDIDIPGQISDNIILSTMHGCPPDEIEKIGLYLIQKKKLHTIIKLNPTLLGQEVLCDILNHKLGFPTQVPYEAFAHDLKYPEAVKIIRKLTEAARENKVHFGLKLTNTLESINNRDVFKSSEKMMYMSGRALHPVSVHLALKLQQEFEGKLDISFSAGGDCFNFSELLSCGLSPLTVCSDILKPGGYGRLNQYIAAISKDFAESKALSPSEFITAKAHEQHPEKASLLNLNVYAPLTLQNPSYRKDSYHIPDIKTMRSLGLFDCIAAPCVSTCPSNQEIPQYLYHVANGEPDKALGVILRTNPFPNVCGMVCDHICQTKCTRVNYDQSLLIREVKRFVTENGIVANNVHVKEEKNLKIAIIGAGPSGLACAYFLRLSGFSVSVFETKDIAGGMVSDAIPTFRLTEDAIRKDIEGIKKLGVEIFYNTPVDQSKFGELQKDFQYIYIAVGARLAKKLGIIGEDLHQVLDPLKFLSDVRRGKNLSLGLQIAVIGGGNTAMDVVRTCRRLTGNAGKIILLYRRTRKEMPADSVEIDAALSDGIELMELVSPVSLKSGNGNKIIVTCRRMELCGSDASGRPKPIEVPASDFDLELDHLIPSVGQDVDISFLTGEKVSIDPETFETLLPNVFIGGDALRGGVSIIRAIGDGRKAATAIIAKINTGDFSYAASAKKLSMHQLMVKRSQRINGFKVHEKAYNENMGFSIVSTTLQKADAEAEAARCLYCDELCNICVTVCPNRANISYIVSPISIPSYKIESSVFDKKVLITTSGYLNITQKPQVANICDFCNECGNCTTFCPTEGKPYKDKPRICLTAESFRKEGDAFFISVLEKKSTLIQRKLGSVSTLESKGDFWLYKDDNLQLSLNSADFGVSEVRFFGTHPQNFDTHQVAEMIIIYKGLIGELAFGVE